MNIDTLLNKIIVPNMGNAFYRFTNADNKSWLIPSKNASSALLLYQPSSTKGRVLKKFFPLLCRSSLCRKLIHAEQVKCVLNAELQNLICRIFNVDNFEFAMFLGTPSVHQKITLQIFQDKNILGYCKISDSRDVEELFVAEGRMLTYLHDKGIDNIPHCLFNGNLNGYSVFVQSTVKTSRSAIIHEWSPIHQKFLTDVKCRTQQDILFENSDFYRDIIALKNNLNRLPFSLNVNILRSAILDIENSLSGKMLHFCAYHGDYTPWNMFVEDGSLFVFDWEYAGCTYPPMLDRYHFFLQVAYFEKHWSPTDVISYINSDKGSWVDVNMLILYLLGIFSRYVNREKGSVADNANPQYFFWDEILNYSYPRSNFSNFAP